ncbi:MAG: hypothetical protein KGQ58_08990 [Proteobacteria bacterium]|nr:hypothetical protein [Pseudomonadota bacterium]MDE3208405.1 hypothetical protein [Pseudomonadota bacterium]
MKFETHHILAGYFLLSELGIGLRELIEQLDATGEINTPIGKLVFPIEAEKEISTFFNPFHQDALVSGNRLPVLTLTGA